LLVTLRLLLLLLCKRIETALRNSARLLCSKLAVLSLTEAIIKKERNSININNT
jgi:hypothetical protein